MHVLYVDGIGSNSSNASPENSVLYSVVKRLGELNSNYVDHRIAWPASMAMVGGTKSWNESTRLGIAEITNVVSTLNGEPFVLVGYSGGCRVVREWVDQSHGILDRVKAIGMLSDPFRPQNQNLPGITKTQGWGICGQKFGRLSERTFWAANPGDAITDAKGDSLLRTPADISDVSPQDMFADLSRHLSKGDLQMAYQLDLFRKNPLQWFGALGPRLVQARNDLVGYLGSQHTTDYLRPYLGGGSLTHRLAEALDWQVTH